MIEDHTRLVNEYEKLRDKYYPNDTDREQR